MSIKDVPRAALLDNHHPHSQSQNDKIRRAESRSADSIYTAKPDIGELEQQLVVAGEEKYHRLGWKQLTLLLIVEAIARYY